MAGALKLLGGCFLLFWTLRPIVLAAAVGVWLGGYFLDDGWEQRREWWLLLPLLVLCADLLVKTIRETRWLWAVAALLGFQTLSRLWSGGAEPVAGWFDVAAVFSLTCALVLIGRGEILGPALIVWLTILSVFVTVISLVAFYGPGGHHFVAERFRNVFIYRNEPAPGLNPVLTGMLCGFGAMGAAWFARRGSGTRLARGCWLLAVAVLVFGVLASGSRGAMLAAAAGLLVLVWFQRGAMLPVLVACAVSATVYFAAAVRSDAAAGLIERGSTGRLDIYRWFVARMDLLDVLLGRGMASSASIPEEELGWFVDHPHSSYLAQFYLTGLLGLAMLFVVLAGPARRALGEARCHDALWLALLAHGAVALLFDCAQIFSLHSAPRLEYLLVVVPAALVMGRTGAER